MTPVGDLDPGPPGRTGTALTPVELDVVRLIAQGHTKAAIGQRLFMSVNTVKKHLTHVDAKLNVGERADLSTEVARRNL